MPLPTNHRRRLAVLVAATTLLAACVPAPGAVPATGRGKASAPAPRGSGGLTASPGAPAIAASPGAGGGNGLVPNGGGNLVGADGGTLIGADGASLIGADGASFGRVQRGAALGGVLRVTAGIVAAGGLNLIGADGGSLVGADGGSIVAAGAGNIVAAGAGNIISQNGGQIVAAGAGNYALRQAKDVPAVLPWAGATLRLLAADGTPLAGPDGEPLVATTDMAGRFAWPGLVLARNVVVAVDLPNGKGRITAIATRDAGGTVDVDLASTLTAAFVLERLVTTQKDPGKVLDKLPAAAEAAARQELGRAFEKGGVVPERLDAAAAAELAASLRAADPAVDRGLEAIERILAPAGQAGLGEGLPATEVYLGAVDDVARLADGTVAIACAGDQRVWRIDREGKLRTLAGLGLGLGKLEDAVDGRPGPEIGLGWVHAIAPDGDGLAILDQDVTTGRVRLLRVGADGRVATIWSLADGAEALGARTLALVRAPGGFVVLAAGDIPPRAWRVAPGAATPAHAFPAADAAVLASFTRATGDGAGRAALAVAEEVAGADGASERRTAVYALDPATLAITLQAERIGPAESTARLTVDDAGRLVEQPPAGGLLVGGARLPAGAFGMLAPRDAVVADGADFLVAAGDRVFRATAGGATAIAGTAASPAEIPASRLALRLPTILAIDPEGRQYVYDEEAVRIWRVDLDGIARQAADLDPEVGGAFVVPARMRATKDALAILDDAFAPGRPARVLTIDRAAGGVVEAWRGAADEAVLDVAGRPAGGFSLLVTKTIPAAGPTPARVEAALVEIDAGRKQVARHALADGDVIRLAVGFDGTTWVASEEALYRWTPAGGLAEVPVPDLWAFRFDDWTWLEATPDGHLIASGSGFWRFDPASGVMEDLVPPGGGTVDTEVGAWATWAAYDATGMLFYLEPDYRQVRLVKPAAQRWKPAEE